MVFLPGKGAILKKHYLSAYAGLPKEVYLLFLARIINCMGSFIMPLLTLILTQKLGISKADTGTFTALLTLTQAPTLMLGGKLIDTIGRKKILILCNIVGAFFYALCGIVSNHTAMIAFIVIASNIYIMADPAFDAMLADLTTPENRKASYSLMYLGINIGMTFSPIIGGQLFQNHLSLLFLLDAITTIAFTIVIALGIPEVYHRNSQKEKQTGTERKKQSAFFVLRAVPVLLMFIVLMFTYDFCYSQWNFMLPIQFGDLFGDSSAEFYSLLSASNAFTVIVLTPLVTSLTHRFRPLAVVAFGGFLYFVSYLGFSVGNSLILFWISTELFTLGEIVTTINIGTFLANHSPADYRGRINAFSSFVRGAARAAGPFLMGHVLSVLNYHTSWRIVAVVVLTGSLGMFILYRKEKMTSVYEETEKAAL